MIYLKSFVAGVAALFLSVVLIWLGVEAFLLFKVAFTKYSENHTGGEIGFHLLFDLRGLAGSPVFWMIVLLIFGLGFYWEFRRASR